MQNLNKVLARQVKIGEGIIKKIYPLDSVLSEKDLSLMIDNKVIPADSLSKLVSGERINFKLTNINELPRSVKRTLESVDKFLGMNDNITKTFYKAEEDCEDLFSISIVKKLVGFELQTTISFE